MGKVRVLDYEKEESKWMDSVIAAATDGRKWNPARVMIPATMPQIMPKSHPTRTVLFTGSAETTDPTSIRIFIREKMCRRST